MRHRVPPIRADYFVSELWANIAFLGDEFPNAVYSAPHGSSCGFYTRGKISTPVEAESAALRKLVSTEGCLLGVAILRSFPQLRRRLEYVDDQLQLNVRALYSELVARQWLTEQHLSDGEIEALKLDLRKLTALHQLQDLGFSWGECVARLHQQKMMPK